jgi:hypothetical protein
VQVEAELVDHVEPCCRPYLPAARRLVLLRGPGLASTVAPRVVSTARGDRWTSSADRW